MLYLYLVSQHSSEVTTATSLHTQYVLLTMRTAVWIDQHGANVGAISEGPFVDGRHKLAPPVGAISFSLAFVRPSTHHISKDMMCLRRRTKTSNILTLRENVLQLCNSSLSPLRDQSLENDQVFFNGLTLNN